MTDKPAYALRERVVYKYPLDQPYQEIAVRAGSVLRHMAVVKGQPVLWIEQTAQAPDLREEVWRFRTVGTGHQFSEVHGQEYVGSDRCVETGLVWHVYRLAHSDPSEVDH